MHSLVYVSSAVEPFSRADLVALLDQSRTRNEAAGITGLLLYKDGNFMQALEGEKEAVEATHARIERDPRHRGLIVLLRGPAPERRFAGWSMAFRDLSGGAGTDAPGYSPFLNTPFTGDEFASDPGKAERLLLSFKRSM
ncbi:MAG: BLUF domain-containing protein [Gemmataceae bacterium]|nr:BLUF domain-containing protein [Gemmataceae bacterium]